MRRKNAMQALRFAAIISALTLTLSGCSTPAPVMKLTASIYPVYCMLRQLTAGVENVSVECLATINAGCAHDYQITSADRTLLADSSLLAMNGAGMEPYLDDLLPVINAKIVETSSGLTLLPGDGHDGEFNPHTWLSPRNASVQSDTLAAALKELLPGQASIIERNRADASSRYTAMDAELTAALAPHKGAIIITFHPAFEYLAQAYGLTIAATLTDDPHVSPSARRLSDIIDIVRSADIGVIFADRESDLTGAQTVSRETGAVIRYLDTATYPMDGVSDMDVYFTATRANMAALLEAFAK
ncbi:MAG: metal ABC transporter substrate-binding protein [Oscillospiraceae bacterium]|nr:metal ABC transporter substrate-binding protein [Oscillospiraceae bacterium]